MAFSLLRRLFRSIKSKRRQHQQQHQHQHQHQHATPRTHLPVPDLLDIVAANENDPIVIADAVAVRVFSPPVGRRTIIISSHGPRLPPAGCSELDASPSHGALIRPMPLELPSRVRQTQKLPPRLPPSMGRLRSPSCPSSIRYPVVGSSVPYAPRSVRPHSAMPLQLQAQRPLSLSTQDRCPLVDLRALRSPARSRSSSDRRASTAGGADLVPFRSRMLLNSSTGGSSGNRRSLPLLPVLAAAAPALPASPRVLPPQRRVFPSPLPAAPQRPSWEPVSRRSGRPHSVPTMRTTLAATSITTSRRVSTTFDEILASIDEPAEPAKTKTAAVPIRRHSTPPTPALDRPLPPLPPLPPSPSSPAETTTSAAPYELSADPVSASAPAPAAPAVPALPLWLTASSSAQTPRRIAFNSREGHILLLSLRRLLELPADGMSGAETLLYVLRHARVRRLAPPAVADRGSNTMLSSDNTTTLQDPPARLVARCNRISWYGLLQAMMHAGGPSQPDRYHHHQKTTHHPLARFSAMDCALVASWIASGEPLFTPKTAPTDLLLRRHQSQRLPLPPPSSSPTPAARRARRQLAASSREGGSRRLRRHHTWAGHQPSPLSTYLLCASELM